MDLLEFMNMFSNDEICEKYLYGVMFSNGVQCPYCKQTKIYTLTTKSKYVTYKCAKCKERFSVLTNTIFDQTRIPLQKWFLAIYLLTSTKKGISSVELAKKLKITQKTAWFLLHRIRECMNNNNLQLFGEIEMDETFIGGKEKNKHEHKRLKQGRGTAGKIAVMGAVSRASKQAIAYPVKEVTYNSVGRFVRDNLKKGSVVFADECTAYDKHTMLRVNHSKKQYVDGGIHTNNIESFWATIKRGYIGIYHHWSKKHLKRYIREFTFRFNNRRGDIMDAVVRNTLGRRLQYKMLTRGVIQ